jgi:hypothetical protein
MKKIMFLSLLVGMLFFITSGAFAASANDPHVFLAYRTDGVVSDGKANYGGDHTRFSWVYLGINGGDSKSKGTLEIKDAEYTFGTWDDFRGKKGNSINGESHTFDLSYIDVILGRKAHAPVIDNKNVIFYGAAQTGLSEKTISWTLGKTSGEITLPKIRSTSEQLSSYVPYVEYVLMDDKVTGLILRMVKPDEPENAITKEDDDTGFREFGKVNLLGLSPNWEHLQEIKIDKKFKPGDVIEVGLKVNPPQTPRFIGVVEVWYKDETQTEGTEVWQRWNFYKRNI